MSKPPPSAPFLSRETSNSMPSTFHFVTPAIPLEKSHVGSLDTRMHSLVRYPAFDDRI